MISPGRDCYSNFSCWDCNLLSMGSVAFFGAFVEDWAKSSKDWWLFSCGNNEWGVNLHVSINAIQIICCWRILCNFVLQNLVMVVYYFFSNMCEFAELGQCMKILRKWLAFCSQETLLSFFIFFLFEVEIPSFWQNWLTISICTHDSWKNKTAQFGN